MSFENNLKVILAYEKLFRDIHNMPKFPTGFDLAIKPIPVPNATISSLQTLSNTIKSLQPFIDVSKYASDWQKNLLPVFVDIKIPNYSNILVDLIEKNQQTFKNLNIPLTQLFEKIDFNSSLIQAAAKFTDIAAQFSVPIELEEFEFVTNDAEETINSFQALDSETINEFITETSEALESYRPSVGERFDIIFRKIANVISLKGFTLNQKIQILGIIIPTVIGLASLAVSYAALKSSSSDDEYKTVMIDSKLWSSPDMRRKPIRLLHPGMTMEIIDTKKRMAHVLYTDTEGNSISGWISNKAFEEE